MKIQPICVLFIAWLVVVQGKNKVIQCYSCDDCDLLNDCLLQSCPLDIEVTNPETTPTPVTESTPTTTILPTIFTSETPKTDSTQPATAFPTTTEILSTIFTSEIPKTTASTYETSPTGIETESEPSELTSETEDASSSPLQSTTNAMQSSTTGTTDTDDPTLLPDELVTRRSLERYDSSITYHCYSIDVVENYKQKTKRGCVEVQENESACGVLRQEYGCSAKNCKVCSTDGCNCNGALRSSLLAVIAITLCGLLSKC